MNRNRLLKSYDGIKLPGQRKAVFITFEGPECSGKGEQVLRLHNNLSAQGLSVISNFREPGTTVPGEILRTIVKGKHDAPFGFPKTDVEYRKLGLVQADLNETPLPEYARICIERAIGLMQPGIKREVLEELLKTEPDLRYILTHIDTRVESWQTQKFIAEKLTPQVKELLFYASRNILCNTVLPEALQLYDVVILDRFKDSTTVYQGHSEGRDPIAIRAENLLATEGILPDITLLLQINTKTLEERRRKGRHIYDDFDSQKQDFHERIIGGYDKEVAHYVSLPSTHPEHGRIVLIDGNPDRDTVESSIYGAVSAKLPAKK